MTQAETMMRKENDGKRTEDPMRASASGLDLRAAALRSQRVQALQRRQAELAPAIADTDAPVILRLHALLPRSSANGPGMRAVIWFQGCTRGCPGCFNPETHASDSRLMIPATALAHDLASRQSEIEGITVSGGEPLEQPEGLLQLLTALRATTHLSTVLFSGYTLDEAMKMTCGPRILWLVDVLIAGPFVQPQRIARGLRGSANQVVHLLTNRYTARDIANTPPGEICIDPSGDIRLTGVAPRRITDCGMPADRRDRSWERTWIVTRHDDLAGEGKKAR